jgi:nucleotide-binding universal stress UspA family protein
MYCKNILFATSSFGEQQSQVTQQVQSCAQHLKANVQHLQVTAKPTPHVLGYSYFSDTVCKSGHFAKVMSQYAKTTTPDLIITPSAGKASWFSDEHKTVLRDAKYDVLFVKGQYQSYRQIIVAVDVENYRSAHFIIGRAKQFADEVGAELHLLYVFPHSSLESLQYGGSFKPDDISEIGSLAAWNALCELAAEHGVDERDIAFRIGDLKYFVEEESTQVGADLLVMGNVEHYGIAKLAPSTSARMLHHTPCDLLALRISQDALPMTYEPLESKRFDEY